MTSHRNETVLWSKEQKLEKEEEEEEEERPTRTQSVGRIIISEVHITNYAVRSTYPYNVPFAGIQHWSTLAWQTKSRNAFYAFQLE